MDKFRLQSEYVQANSRLLLLDYDGVLAPIMPLPEQAAPSARVRQLLQKLTASSKNLCVVVSGRPKETLDEWLGDLPLAFAAEHGLWRREPSGEWMAAVQVKTAWKQPVRALMEDAATGLKGAFVEEKSAAIAFHYRNAEAEPVKRVLPGLVGRLSSVAAEFSLRVLEGKKVVELLAEHVDKGTAARQWLETRQWDLVLAAGDDVTDEALFTAMPEVAYTIKVGAPPTAARMQIESQPAFVELLESLADLT